MFLKVLSIFILSIMCLCLNVYAGSTVVVPNANINTDGNGLNVLPFACNIEEIRYQQLYDSSQFEGPCYITEIRLRRDAAGVDLGPADVSNVIIQFSTSPNDVSSISSTFADNIGSDVVTVFDGTIKVHTDCGSDNPCPFDQDFPFQQGIMYDPNQGDLLIDVRMPSCSIVGEPNGYDAVFDSLVVSRAGSDNDVNSPTADFMGPDGLVTQFVCGEPPTEGPIAVVPTMGQWGIIFASILLGVFGVLAILREKKLGIYFRK